MVMPLRENFLGSIIENDLLNKIDMPLDVASKLRSLGQDDTNLTFKVDGNNLYILANDGVDPRGLTVKSTYKFNLLTGQYIGKFTPSLGHIPQYSPKPEGANTNTGIDFNFETVDGRNYIMLKGTYTIEFSTYLYSGVNYLTGSLFQLFDYEFNAIGSLNKLDPRELLYNERGQGNLPNITASVTSLIKGTLPPGGENAGQLFYFPMTWYWDNKSGKARGYGIFDCMNSNLIFKHIMITEPNANYPVIANNEYLTGVNTFYYNNVIFQNASDQDWHSGGGDWYTNEPGTGNKIYSGYMPNEIVAPTVPALAVENPVYFTGWGSGTIDPHPYLSYSTKKGSFLVTLWVSEMNGGKEYLIRKETRLATENDHDFIPSIKLDALTHVFAPVSGTVYSGIDFVGGSWIFSDYLYVLVIQQASPGYGLKNINAKIQKYSSINGSLIAESQQFTIYTKADSGGRHHSLINDIGVLGAGEIFYGSGPYYFLAFRPDTLEVTLRTSSFIKDNYLSQLSNGAIRGAYNYFSPVLDTNNIYKLRTIVNSYPLSNVDDIYLSELEVVYDNYNPDGSYPKIGPYNLDIKAFDPLGRPVSNFTINGHDVTRNIFFTGVPFNYATDFQLQATFSHPNYADKVIDQIITAGTSVLNVTLPYKPSLLYIDVVDQFGVSVSNPTINGTDLVYGTTFTGNSYAYQGDSYLELDIKAAGYDDYFADIEISVGTAQYTVVMTAKQYTLNISVVDDLGAAVPNPVINGSNISNSGTFTTLSYVYYGAWTMDLSVTAAGFKSVQFFEDIVPGTTDYIVTMERLYGLNIVVKNILGQLVPNPIISGTNMTLGEYFFEPLYEYTKAFNLSILVTAAGYNDFNVVDLIPLGTLEFPIVMKLSSELTAPYLVDYEFIASEGIILMSVDGKSAGKAHFRVQVYQDEAATILIKEISSQDLYNQFKYSAQGIFTTFPASGILIKELVEISVKFDAGPLDKFYVKLGSYELEATPEDLL